MDSLEKSLARKYARRIFELAERTVAPRTDGFPDRESARREHRDALDLFAHETDSGFFRRHVAVVFFSGFRASVVEAKLPALYHAFPDAGAVSEYDSRQIDSLMSDPRIIRNRAKITAVVANAGAFRTIAEQHGSFRNYVLSFNQGFPEGAGDPVDIQSDLDRLQADVMNRLAYFGPATTRHFLVDYGFSFIKPVGHVMRLLDRLGLVSADAKDSYQDAVRIGRLIAEEVDVPIGYVDTVLSAMGMAGEANLCRKTDPLCSECQLRVMCVYAARQGSRW